MNHVLVSPLILALFSSGCCYVTAMKEIRCLEMCPPGYYKTGGCRDRPDKPDWHECNKCGENTFTNINNTSSECQRCNVCGIRQVIIQNCTTSSNYVCDCEKDYYNTFRTDDLNCKSCRSPPSTTHENDTDYIKKCKPCQSSGCLSRPECGRKYGCAATTRAPANTSTSTTMSAIFTRVTTTGTARPSQLPPKDHNVFHFVLLAVIFAVIFGLLLLKKLFGELGRCPYWRTKKVVLAHTEDPKLTERHSHQDTSTTLIINAYEGTPLMNLSQSPSTSEHPAPASAMLPNTDHRAVRQDEQSQRWPAIVLYTIIKEVPLRRWKEFLRLLSVADEQLERIELEAGLGMGSMERQYLMLRLWSQRATANLNDIFSALHYMDLSRSAQMLQENLENLQWKAESKQDFPA